MYDTRTRPLGCRDSSTLGRGGAWGGERIVKLARRRGGLSLAVLGLLAAPLAAPAWPDVEPSEGDSCSPGSAAYATGGEPGRGFPNDPLLDRQWGLTQVRAQEAWRAGARGQGVVVAVVDTGIDLGHPDLDDKLVPGIDLVDAGSDPCGPQDTNYHGTMVAGVIAAETGNGLGIAGVAPAARLMPVRVRESLDGIDYAHVGHGIRWAADHGAQVISVTGGTLLPVKPDPVVLEDIDTAAEYAWNAGAVLVATAGNNSLPWCQYPASLPHMVCAAATDRAGLPPGWSQLPVHLGGGVAVRAPGGSRLGSCVADDIWSTTVPGSSRDCGGGYGSDSGTTFAVAHTAGVAALLAGSGLSNEEVVECLRTTSSNGGSYDPVMGYGIVDAAAAVQKCVPRKGKGPKKRAAR